MHPFVKVTNYATSRSKFHGIVIDKLPINTNVESKNKQTKKKQRQNTAFPLKSCQNEQFHGNSSLWPNTNCCHHTVRLRGIRFMMDKSVTTGHQNGNINFENCVSKTICCGAVLSMCCSCLTRCIKGSDEGNRVSFSV